MSKKLYIRVDKPIEVGDLVRCVRDDYPRKIGDIGKVKDLVHSWCGTFTVNMIKLCGCGTIMVPTAWEPVHKLKVGDKVVFNRRIKTVTGIKPDSNRFYTTDGPSTYICNSQFELYQPEKHDPKPTPLTSDGRVISGPNIYSTTLHGALHIPSSSKCLANGIDFKKTVQNDFMKRQIAEMIVELLDKDVTQNGLLLANYRTLNETINVNSINNRSYKATLSPNDTWDTLTGVYVALCKATGRKLPDWIYGEGR